MTYNDISLKYDEVVQKCKDSGEPIYITNNGKPELVVMDVASFKRREQNMTAQELILEAYAARLKGEKDYSIKESKKLIDKIIENN